MKKILLSIEGMSCSACSNGLEKYLNRQVGVKKSSVNLVMATANIEYEDNLTINYLENFIADAGFKSLGVAKLEENDSKINKLPFIIYGFLAIMLMYISMSHMLHLPVIPFLHMSKYPVNYSVCLTIMTIPFLIYGFDIIKSGVKNLIHKMPNMDTLVGIGVVSSFLYSFFGVIMILLGHKEYVEHLYFESTAFVIYFIKLGRFIDKNSKEKTRDAIRKLVTITPKTAKIKTEDGYLEITIDEVKKGDILCAPAGDKIAVDGKIVDGETHLDESFITGESKPVRKKVNDKVIAGSINYDNIIFYEAEKIGKDSTISEIVQLVVEATNTKAPISLLADKISHYFVPVIMLIALLTFLLSLIFGLSFSISLTRFVTVLVVACPCALGLATPLAIVVSEGVCAKNGILVKKSETLELASKINTVVFDKTGTLTNGNLTISKIFNYSAYSDNDLLSILGSLEYASTHPIAKGVMTYIEKHNIEFAKNLKIETIAGLGIRGLKGKKDYYAGNAKLLKKININNKYSSDEENLTNNGNSIIYIVEDKKIIGLIGIKDTIRTVSKDTIASLKKLNIDVVMLTGDNNETALKIGKELGIENIIFDVVPKQKAEVIKEFKQNGKKVMMVGDGINDAPSLVLADIGVSITGATDIASSSADVILMNDNLLKIVDFIYIGKKTLINIKQNLFWAFFYNICMIPLAMGIFTKWNLTINPMIACISMILSSLFVIFNALRLKRIKLKGNSSKG